MSEYFEWEVYSSALASVLQRGSAHSLEHAMRVADCVMADENLPRMYASVVKAELSMVDGERLVKETMYKKDYGDSEWRLGDNG